MMIKVYELVKRRPDLTVEQFQDYWLTTHGPIVSCIPGIQRYVQSHPLLGGYRKGPLPYEGREGERVDADLTGSPSTLDAALALIAMKGRIVLCAPSLATVKQSCHRVQKTILTWCCSVAGWKASTCAGDLNIA